MILIIGGAYQGKLKYTTEKYQIKNNEVAHGEAVDLNKISHYKLINNFHLLVKRLIADTLDLDLEIEKILSSSKDRIIISDEIFSGIVPIDSNDRLWREKLGKALIKIAAHSDTVIRINCSIPTFIKGGE